MLLEVRCEVIDVRAAAASKFEHLARWRKQRLEHVQDRVPIALARPGNIGAQRIGVDGGPVGRDNGCHAVLLFHLVRI